MSMLMMDYWTAGRDLEDFAGRLRSQMEVIEPFQDAHSPLKLHAQQGRHQQVPPDWTIL